MCLHALAFCNLSHLGIIQPALTVNTGVREIAVHPVDLCQIAASALGAGIHFQFLMAAVVAIGQGKINAFIEAHLHGAANQRADCIFVVTDRIADVLNLAAV